jgi:signal transduction histidine kinase
MASVRRKLESELRREDRLRAVGRLAAGLAHEIRNPLNSIRLTVQLLERRLDTNSIRREDLRTVQTEVDRLSALLNDLLDLQRSGQPVSRDATRSSDHPALHQLGGAASRNAEHQHSSRITPEGDARLLRFTAIDLNGREPAVECTRSLARRYGTCPGV